MKHEINKTTEVQNYALGSKGTFTVDDVFYHMVSIGRAFHEVNIRHALGKMRCVVIGNKIRWVGFDPREGINGADKCKGCWFTRSTTVGCSRYGEAMEKKDGNRVVPVPVSGK